MLPLQGKSQAIVVKALPKGVDPVVAGEAALPEGIQMLIHEGSVDLPMAVGASRLIERTDIIPVAVGAGKGCPGRVYPVPLKGEADRLVGEALQVHRRHGCLRSVVVGVAREAFQCLALRQHDLMEVVCAGFEVHMAAQAEVRHFRAARKQRGRQRSALRSQHGRRHLPGVGGRSVRSIPPD